MRMHLPVALLSIVLLSSVPVLAAGSPGTAPANSSSVAPAGSGQDEGGSGAQAQPSAASGQAMGKPAPGPRGMGLDGQSQIGGLWFFVVMLAVMVFMIVAWWNIFSKAGHSGALALLMLIPLVNVIVFLWFAFSRWPVQNRPPAGLQTGPQPGPMVPPPPRY